MRGVLGHQTSRAWVDDMTAVVRGPVEQLVETAVEAAQMYERTGSFKISRTKSAVFASNAKLGKKLDVVDIWSDFYIYLC